jgi:hypothetical protein
MCGLSGLTFFSEGIKKACATLLHYCLQRSLVISAVMQYSNMKQSSKVCLHTICLQKICVDNESH